MSDRAWTRRQEAVEPWEGSCASRGFLVLSALLTLAAVALLSFAPQAWWVGLIVALIGVLMLLVGGMLQVRINDRAVNVRFGVLGVPSKSVKLERIAAASVIDVRPRQWGGWGYRWLPHKHATAALVRAGEGLRLDLTNGKVFVITVVDAEDALAALQRFRSPTT